MVKEFVKSLEYASIIQRGALPKSRHLEKLFDDFFILYLPAQYVSGDFFWVTQKNDYNYVIVGDCTGHGVPGSLLTMLMINIIDYSIQKCPDSVSDILKEIDKKFFGEIIISKRSMEWDICLRIRR